MDTTTHRRPWHTTFAAIFGVASFLTHAQTGILSNGAACGCPEVAARDTVWVSDNDGNGVGTAQWDCAHLYVLTEQVFVNEGDTLRIDPGTVVLGMEGEGRTEVDNVTGFGAVRDVTYDTYPGALVVARGGFLEADGTATCPIQFSFLGDPMDGTTGLDVRGKWGGIVVCGEAQLNTLSLEQTFATAPFFTTGIGTGEDRAEGILDVSGQDRHVYGGNADSINASAVLRHLSIRHGSTNLGWNQFGNGNETDLLQLNACGAETVVEHVECLSSADDGLHVFGGMVELRHILSAFHSEDAYECDQGWQGMAQFLVGIQDTLLAQPTNPPGNAFLFDVEGDDVEEFNVDLGEEPHTKPVVHNMTLVTNGAPQAVSYHSLPGGDWQNSIAHGMSDAGAEIQHYFSCDGYPAMTQWQILRVRNWRFAGSYEGEEGIELGRYNGNYNNQAAFNELLADSTCTVETMLVDADFSIVDGQLVDGLDLHPLSNATVSAHYMATDPRLEAVPYHGAIAVGEVPWFMATTYASSTGLFGPEPELDVPGPGCMYPSACNYDALAVEDDGSCDFNSCAGCMYVLACNYSPSALKDDGSCEWESCAGCTFPDAENYDPAAAWDNGTCTFGPPVDSCPADINADGFIGTLDLLDLLSGYGDLCADD